MRTIVLLSAALLIACTNESDPATTTGAGGTSANTTGVGASTSSSGGESTTSTGGSGGSGAGVPNGKVPMFVAQGHVGSTVVSCDDGATWIGYRTFETEASPLVCGSSAAVRCFTGACEYLDGDQMCQSTAANCDCDHHPGSGKGLAFGEDAFVATYGWGQPGVVLRSTDGFTWSQVGSGDTFADVAAGNGMVVLSARSPEVSTDDGLTFTTGTDSQHVPWNVRRMFYFPESQQFMSSAASGAERDVRLTADFQAWDTPTTMPYDCTNISEAIEADGHIVTRGSASYVCVSNDGGDTFARVDLPNAPSLFSGPVWDGEQLIVWGDQGGVKAYTSADAETWTEHATALTGGDRFGEVARNPVTGTMVAARDQWQNWYEDMRWYRSTDGINWETLSAGAGIESHPMREMTFGWADPSTQCPLPE